MNGKIRICRLLRCYYPFLNGFNCIANIFIMYIYELYDAWHWLDCISSQSIELFLGACCSDVECHYFIFSLLILTISVLLPHDNYYLLHRCPWSLLVNRVFSFYIWTAFIDLLIEYWIEHFAIGSLIVNFAFSIRILFREFQALQRIVSAMSGALD